MSNALDEALQKLNASCNALERHRPGIKDVDEAKKAAKDAAEILDSAHKLMLRGIYSVADEPAEERFHDTAIHQIYLPIVAEEPTLAPAPVELLPFPEELALFDTWDEDNAQEIFSNRLDALDDRQEESRRGVDVGFEPWDSLWDENHKDAFTRLLVAEAREVPSLALPTEAERDAWLAQFAPVEVYAPVFSDYLNSWEAWTEEERKAQFDAQLETLVACYIEMNPDQVETLYTLPFLEIYGDNPLWAFRSVLFCLAQEPVLFVYPDAQDVASWVDGLTAAPVAEAADQDATFETQLLELAELGVSEGGLKRKAWKAAEKVWRNRYLMAPAWTLEALTWRLAQSTITWDVPTPEEMEFPAIAHASGE